MDAPFLCDWIKRAQSHLALDAGLINQLNVYPVPDGDTGSNMLGTLTAALDALKDGVQEEGGSARALVKGALLGARGNSGIILSQIVKGIVSVLGDSDPTPLSLTAALEAADREARAAVSEIVEGTMLTATRAAAEAARSCLRRKDGTAEVLEVAEAARAAGITAMRKSPELLPVLAQSGVVDSGAAGLVLFLDAVVDVVGGECIKTLKNVLPQEVLERLAEPVTVEGKEEHRESAGPKYEVMFLLEANEEAVEALKRVWADLGDSIAIVGVEGLYNCHIHTDDIGGAIEAGIDAGRVRNIRVTDLSEQVGEERWVREVAQAGAVLNDPDDIAPAPVTTAVVAVANGEGLKRILHSFGAQKVILCSETMNPSVKEILQAVEQVPSSAVIILPNNKNVIPVAREAARLCGRPAEVVETTSVVEGISSLVAYDPEASLDENLREMREALNRVTVAEVTQAVREAACSLGPIVAGDYLGLTSEGIQVISKTAVGAVCGLLRKLVQPQHEILTLFEGEGATARDTHEIVEFVKEEFPSLEVEVHHGGQPHHPYLLSLE